MPDLARYLRAVLVRLERLPRDATRDRALMAGVHEVEAEWSRLPDGDDRRRIRWLIEELRVSLFAQTVKAKGPISVQRVFKALDELA